MDSSIYGNAFATASPSLPPPAPQHSLAARPGGAGPMVSSQLTPQGIVNAWQSPAQHYQVNFPANQTPFQANLFCGSRGGAPTVNNSCVSAGGVSSVPFRTPTPGMKSMYLNALFTPTEPSMFQPLPSSATMLTRERGPVCDPNKPSCTLAKQGYGMLDLMSL